MFYFNVCLSAKIDVGTGLPFYYAPVKEGEVSLKYYSPEDFVIPEKFRKYMCMCQSLLSVYVDFCDYNSSQLTIDQFLTNFPTWSHVKTKIGANTWTEDDHTQFYEALNWLNNKQIFSVSWVT